MKLFRVSIYLLCSKTVLLSRPVLPKIQGVELRPTGPAKYIHCLCEKHRETLSQNKKYIKMNEA